MFEGRSVVLTHLFTMCLTSALVAKMMFAVVGELNDNTKKISKIFALCK